MNNSKGRLIGIGVGPGDPDLLTVKAVKTLESVPVICSPKSSKNKPSVALSMVIDPIILAAEAACKKLKNSLKNK
jgi:precorrin-2/cobalt-factor-2 C20-methyltransferase